MGIALWGIAFLAIVFACCAYLLGGNGTGRWF